MVIYDITKELFSTMAYPGDPVPKKETWLSMKNGDFCNLSILNIGSHSGTHIDAPRHFIENGKSVDEIPLERCIGNCQVVYCKGRIASDFWSDNLIKGANKLLIRGEVVLDEDAAAKIVEHGINLIGVEASTVGDKTCQKEVHIKFLENDVVILENLNLEGISNGEYFLVAQPLKMHDVDGSPVRALLIADK